MSSFLGVQFVRTQEGAVLTQEIYTKKVLSRFGMSLCRPVSTPAVQRKADDETNKSDAKVNAVHYMEIVGSLMFLAKRTRLDIAYAVNLLSRKAARPTEEDNARCQACLKIFK